MKRLLCPVLLLSLALAVPSGAATPGPQKAAAYMSMKVHAGHDYEVQLLGSEPLAGSPNLQISIRDLTAGGDELGYDGALPAAALSVTDTGAALRTQVAGVPLVVTWTVGRGVAVSGDSVSTTSTGYQVAGHDASVRASLGSTRCAIQEFGVLGYAVGDGAPDSAPLAKAFAGMHLDGATCGDVDYSTLPPS